MKKGMMLLIFGGAVCFVFISLTTIYGQDVTRPIVYSIPGMNNVKVRPDIVYKRDNGEELKMDIYTPNGLAASDRRPAILFIHGGPLGQNVKPTPKDWGFYTSYGQLMAASGFVGVTFNYRYTGTSAKELEKSSSDVDAAIRFIRTNSDSYNIDPERIALWAFSGGGSQISVALRGHSKFIRCIISYYAILDLESDITPFREKPEVPEKFSPVAYLTESSDYVPSVLIARAGLDYPSFNRSVERFVAKMFALNGDITVLSHPFGHHAFDLEDDNEQTRTVIATTVAFLKDRLGWPVAFKSKSARSASEFKALLSEGKIEDAREFVRKNLSAPEDKTLTDSLVSDGQLVNVGVSLLGPNPGAALKALQWAADLNPNSSAPHFYMALTNEAISRKDQAVAEAQKALALLEKETNLAETEKVAVREAMAALLKRNQ